MRPDLKTHFEGEGLASDLLHHEPPLEKVLSFVLRHGLQEAWKQPCHDGQEMEKMVVATPT